MKNKDVTQNNLLIGGSVGTFLSIVDLLGVPLEQFVYEGFIVYWGIEGQINITS